MILESSRLDRQVREAFSRAEPNRHKMRYMVLAREPKLIVRIYSYVIGNPEMRPTPYQIFEFDPEGGLLRKLQGEEAAPYIIKGYK
jgi:hypothetical protein